MKARTAARLGWGSLALSAVLTAFEFLFRELARPPHDALDGVGEALLVLPFAVVGAVIVARRPRNAVGWVFCGIGLSGAIQSFAFGYALHTLVTARGSLPGGVAAAWVAFALWPLPNVLLLLYVPLLFPDGRLPSRRWRPVAWAGLVLTLVTVAGSGLRPGVLDPDDVPMVANPFGIAGAEDALELLDGIAFLAFIPLGLAALAALILRFRRARGVERQQLKWVVFALAAMVGSLFLTPLMALMMPALPEWLVDIAFGVIFMTLPVAMGVAVLRYRLYEIDRIVSRTVTYAVVTGLLAAVYLGGVVLLQALLRPVAGESQLAVAGSTLLVAALFGPARRRIQDTVDRRFNRQRYDSARTVESFRGRVRDEVDLDELSAGLLAAVGQTVEPARAALWLRAGERRA